MQQRAHAASCFPGSFARLYRHTVEDITRLIAVHDDQGTANFGSPSVGPLLGHAFGDVFNLDHFMRAVRSSEDSRFSIVKLPKREPHRA
jgi:hypothetical protein